MERNPNIQRSILDEIHLPETRYISVYEYKRILEEDYQMSTSIIALKLAKLIHAKPEERNEIMHNDLVGLEQDMAYQSDMPKFFYEMVLN
jgi:hypothetical protein